MHSGSRDARPSALETPPIVPFIGREAERGRLRNAIADPSISLILVRGASGAGKTAFVDTVLAEATSNRSIVGRGKYAQGAASGAFSPILEALSQAASVALDMLYDPAAGVASLAAAMGWRLGLLSAAGFRIADLAAAPLEAAVGPLGGQASVARVVEAAMCLLRWLEGFGAPVLLFVDDWQRAPAEARQFAAAAAYELRGRRCSLVLAERIHESMPAARADEVIILGELTADEAQLLLDGATGTPGAGRVLTNWLGNDTSRLPLDLLEIARGVRERTVLVHEAGTWQVDEQRAVLLDRADITRMAVERARALSPSAITAGAALALWGDGTSLEHLASALGLPADAVASDLVTLERSGITGLADGAVAFVHDRMRAAILEAVAPDRLAEIADAMAERMVQWAPAEWSAVSATGLNLRLAGGLTDGNAAGWCDHFVTGARAARMNADMVNAARFAEAALTLLNYTSESPDRMRLVFHEALFAAAHRRDGRALVDCAERLLAVSPSPQQRGEAYEAAIMAARLVGDMALAWTWSQEALRKIGLGLPQTASRRHVVFAALRWRSGMLARGRSGSQDTVRSAADPLVRVANIAGVVAFDQAPRQALLIAMRAAARARRLGIRSAIWTSTDCFLAACLGQYERAARLGELAESEVRHPGIARAAALYRAVYFGMIWQRPLPSLREAGLRAYELALAEGDMATATSAIRNDALLAWRCSPSLQELRSALAGCMDRARRLGDANAQEAVAHYADLAAILSSPDCRDRIVLEYPPGITPDWAMRIPVVWMEFLSLRGAWEALNAFAERMVKARPDLDSHPGGIVWRFHRALARNRLGLVPLAADLAFIRRAAAMNPADHRAKHLVLTADRLRSRGKREACLAAYARATDLAVDGFSRLEAGLIAEQAAYAAHALGDAYNAERYDALARDVWLSWGTVFKEALQGVRPLGEDVEHRLAVAQSQAATAMRSERAKSRFMAEVAHELRTPLQAMQSLLEAAAERKDDGEMRELLDVMGSLRNVVDDLTELGALGADAPLRPGAVDLVALLQSEAAAFAASARRKGLGFLISVIDDDVRGTYHLDAPRLRQIVRNLLSNAVKYTDEGEVHLRIAVMRMRDDAADLEVSVEDTGPGFLATDLARLFEPFERQGRGDAQGLGLGLALSRRIARRMGGDLIAGNRPGGGARFVLTFAAPRALAQTGEPAPLQAPLRVLLVEDVALNRQLLAATLRRDGHTVVEAGTASEALDAWEAGALDACLLDLGLPDRDGFEVLARMRRMHPETPVIIVTGAAVPSVDERARRGGAARILHKPVSAGELRMALAGLNVVPATEPSSFADEVASLLVEAESEIVAASSDLLRSAASLDSITLQKKAHRLAGLAAQFLAAPIAEAADMLEACAVAGADREQALIALQTALSAFEQNAAKRRKIDSEVG